MKKSIVAMALFSTLTAMSSFSQGLVSLSVKNVTVSPNVLVGLKYYTITADSPQCVNLGCQYSINTQELGKLSSENLKKILLLQIVQDALTNVFSPIPDWVHATTGNPAQYIWFGVYNATTGVTQYPESCKVPFNTTRNISVAINPSGCVIS